jgi:predicted GNAT family N-acyltransferase
VQREGEKYRCEATAVKPQRRVADRDRRSSGGGVTQQSLFEGLTFKVASDPERAQALNLRRAVYSEEFGEEGVDQLDDGAHQLIAVNSDHRVIASMRVIDSCHRPFDLEHYVDLPRLGPGRSVAEVGRFCVARDYRQVRSGQFVHLGMFKLLCMFADQKSITDLFTLGLSELRTIYKFAFFKEISRECRHPIGGRLVQLMHLDLVDARAKHNKSKHPVARFLFQTNFANIEL